MILVSIFFPLGGVRWGFHLPLTPGKELSPEESRENLDVSRRCHPLPRTERMPELGRYVALTVCDRSATVDVGTQIGKRPCRVEDTRVTPLSASVTGVNNHANLSVLLECKPLEVTDTDVLLIGWHKIFA